MKICLIGVTNPTFNPRLTREADTLSELGHDVRVVTVSRVAALQRRDKRLMASRKWRLESTDISGNTGGLGRLLERLQRRAAREASRLLPYRWIYERAYVPAFAELFRSAVREPADWYIAHAQSALPIAARAARHHRARLGFDCEDLLAIMDAQDDPSEMVLAIEKAYIGRCDYVSVTAECTGNYLRDQYHPRGLTVLYNVFPRALAEGMPPPTERPPRQAGEPLRLHWFGQTIGVNRGVEEIIDAMGRVGRPLELHLRGNISDAFREMLLERGRSLGVGSMLRFHPPEDHDQVIRKMAPYDVGLAVERPGHRNAAMTVSNKLFSYMLAGLAVLASDTAGQREIMAATPEAGELYTAGDIEGLASILRHWADDPAAVRATQTAAWKLARTRYCWDLEKEKLLARLGI